MLSRRAEAVNRRRTSGALRGASFLVVWGMVVSRDTWSFVVLSGWPGIVGDLPRRGTGRGLSAECGKFTGSSEEAADERLVFRFFLGGELSLQRGETVEEQLGNVGQGNGVAAGDALAGELPDEIAEEEIHGTGGGEIIDVAEEIGGEELRVDGGNIGAETAGVVGAERGAVRIIRGTLMLVNQHVTTLAARVFVLALLNSALFWRHDLAFRMIEVKT